MSNLDPEWSIEFLDKGPDDLGRRRFFLYWWSVNPGSNEMPIELDEHGNPKPIRRAQCFFDKPERHGFSVDGRRLERCEEY